MQSYPTIAMGLRLLLGVAHPPNPLRSAKGGFIRHSDESRRFSGRNAHPEGMGVFEP